MAMRPRENGHTYSPSAASTVNPKVALPPPLSFNPWDKKASIILCSLGILFFDLVLPCIIFYVLLSVTSLSIAYAPLGQEAKWGFDFFFWWYLAATVMGIVPYVFATSLDEPILWLFLMTPGFLVGFACLTAAVSVFPFGLPFRVSSDAKGERCKPFAYYVLEDFVAVDAGQMRQFREELKARWEASPVFQRLMWDVNMWWLVGGGNFIGALAAVTWALPFNVAYGLSFGL
ncbi:hypothetical protein LSUE1_G007555, partial [Lachnellula suecica]